MALQLSAEFLTQQQKVKDLEEQFKQERIKLMRLCPHADWLPGTSYRNCRTCGMSEYFHGRENLLG